MDPTIVAGAIGSVLTLIEGLLPQLTALGSTSSVVVNIITALTKIVPLIEKFAPLAQDEFSLIYQGVKNIIGNLRGTVSDADQAAALDALDARVDAAWDAVAPGFDPDAGATAS